MEGTSIKHGGILLAALTVGCAVGPDYHPPTVETPARFYATTEPAMTQPAQTQPAEIDVRRWWESFNDPKLIDLVNRAVVSNLDVQLAEARVREARALLQFNTANLFPTVNGSASYTRSQPSKNAFAFSGGSGTTGGTTGGTGTGTSGGSSSPVSFSITRTNLYQAGFDAGWEIDVFGGTRRAIEAAQYSFEAQVEARRSALVTLLSEVARNYVALRGLQHELAIVRNNVAAQQDTLRLTRSKFDAGIGTDLDVAQIEALVSSTESQIPTLQTQIQQAIHRLAVLLDQPVETLEHELEQASPLPSGAPNVPPGLPSDLLRRRPDVRQAERQVAAATANIGVAVADWFPKFNLTGSLGLESISLKTFANSASEFWSFGPSVQWKIFNAGQIRANVHVQEARQQEALIQYRQAVLQALSDVEDALVAYTQEQARRDALKRSVAANRRAVEMARQLNAAGVVDFLNVLTTEQSLYQSEDQLAQSEQTVSTNLIALYKALGGGWELSEEPAPQDN